MLHGVIMAGGSGTRLWPMSRQSRPKQLLPLFNGRSLLQLAADRLLSLVPAEQLWVCAAQEHAAAIAAELPALSPANWLGEPCGRDTLPAASLAAAVIAKRDPEAVLLTVSADQLIAPTSTFVAAAQTAAEWIARSPVSLVTFGVRPTRAATGYGYLQLANRLADGVLQVAEFREKPDLQTAASYLAEGPERYLWNSGLFAWRASTFWECLERYEPTVAEGLRRIAEVWESPQRAEVLAEVYPSLRRVSLDYAVMEPASHDADVELVAVPLDVDWIDVGSWPSYASTLTPDGDGNAAVGADLASQGARRCTVVSELPEQLVALVGCQDLIVVQTRDALLICQADQAELVKTLLNQLGPALK